MNALFNRWLPAVTLALWGGSILLYSFDGRVKGVLAPEFQVYAIIASVLLVIGALVLAFSKVDASCCADSACSHALSRYKGGRLLTFGIILLPIALAPFGSKAALEQVLGKNRTVSNDASNVPAAVRADYEKRLAATRAVSNPSTTGEDVIAKGNIAPPPPLTLPTKDGSQPPAPVPAPTAPGSQPPAPANPAEKHPAAAEEQSFAEYLQRTPEGYIVAEVLDLLYAAQDNVLRKDFEEKKVQLIVQFMPDNSAKTTGIRFKGVRMFMTCCAADARPIATLIEADKMPEVPEMTWVKVVGTATFPVEKGRRVAVVRAEKVEKTEPPPESMLN
jgi:uncharacterized membrane protein YcgQ (UPF0703/DUF1980 family)